MGWHQSARGKALQRIDTHKFGSLRGLPTFLGIDPSYSPSANATTVSPCLLANLPWPPAQITIYCFPPALKVIGVACALAGSSAFQTSAPVSTSNARR